MSTFLALIVLGLPLIYMGFCWAKSYIGYWRSSCCAPYVCNFAELVRVGSVGARGNGRARLLVVTFLGLPRWIFLV